MASSESEERTVHLVAGARPNFIKIAPLYHAFSRTPGIRPIVVHTGQHYDPEMSDAFFRDLRLPPPDIHLGIGSGTHAEQMGRTMMAYEGVLREAPPDWVVVVGDVNATAAATLAAKKLLIPVAHLEAGLRSGDRTMPEEINRLVTDVLADLLWTHSPDADENLLREGVPPDRIERIGNVMIDAYEMLRDAISAEKAAEGLGLPPDGYAVATIHRPSNVDDPHRLEEVAEALRASAALLPLVLPLHPRTRERLRAASLLTALEKAPGLRLLPPLGYLRFMSLVETARYVLTDSGGLQEETTYLGIPCLTLRENTERPITLTQGTNRLIRPGEIEAAVREILGSEKPTPNPPDLWDGRTAERAVASLRRRFGCPAAPA